jgi:hypothetical protein
MKQIFTLLTIALLTGTTFKANSQNIDEHFETATQVNNLISSCWTFNTVAFTSTSPIVGSGSVISQLGSTSEIITPELLMPTSLTVSFRYSVIASNPGVQKVQVLITDGIIETKFYDANTSGSGTITATFTTSDPQGTNLTGSKKVIIRISNNLNLKVDDLSINTQYTYLGGCSIAAIPLPLKLLSFQGSLNNSQSQLQWTVAENETGKYFEVEKSFDGRSYTTAGMVMTTQKAGSETYSYKEGIQNATFYRLKMVNEDGSVTYSKIILIKAQEATSSTIALLQNPVKDNLSFSFTSLTDKATDVTIYSMSGAKVFTQKIATQKGRNSISVALNNYITSGTYILEVRNNTERNITKFIK